MKDKLERNMKAYQSWSPSRYEKAKAEYEDFLKTFKNKK
jgi:hypothetical protein